MANTLNLLTIPEVAVAMGCSRTHVYELIAQGELPVVDIAASGRRSKSRVRSDDFDAYIKRLTRAAPIAASG